MDVFNCPNDEKESFKQLGSVSEKKIRLLAVSGDSFPDLYLFPYSLVIDCLFRIPLTNSKSHVLALSVGSI